MTIIKIIQRHFQYAREYRELKRSLYTPDGGFDFDKNETYLDEKSRRAAKSHKPGQPLQPTNRVLQLKGKDGQRLSLKPPPPFWVRRDKDRYIAPTDGQTGCVGEMRRSAQAKIARAEELKLDDQMIGNAREALDKLNLSVVACGSKCIDTDFFRQCNATLAALQRAVASAEKRAAT